MATPVAHGAGARDESDAIRREASARRTFAIISHPDAGKTTLTEKFLLYAGAIETAGAVKARRAQQSATSDWMKMERERGISITSTVLRFQRNEWTYNLLDTPGHRDFSEDTYRVLSASDSAVMVLDAARGVEPQTLKLFEVCRQRGIPLISFINKYDRPGLEPLELLDNIRDQIGLEPVPITWPVGKLGDFRGVIVRSTGEFIRYGQTAHGASIAPETVLSAAEAAAQEGDAWREAEEEVALLDEIGATFDEEEFRSGRSTPVFFGSALSNFGVGLLLEAIGRLSPQPAPRPSANGDPRCLEEPFSGFVFKVQANMDPRHRDRIAFLRICSGRFERGMSATHARSGRQIATKYAHELFGRDRETLDVAFPGDIVGLVNASGLGVGDSIYSGEPVVFPPIPSFAPEHFMVASNADAGRYKQFRRALQELDEEGAIQVLRHPDRGDQAPVLAAVGPLQFEVVAQRMETEFGVPLRLTATEFKIARTVDEAGEQILRNHPATTVFHRSNGTRLALFRSDFQLERVERDHPELELRKIVVT